LRFCYVDESGDTRNLLATPPHGGITPVLIVAGVVIDERLLESLTREFIKLKARFYPRLVRHASIDWGAFCPRSRERTFDGRSEPAPVSATDDK
jgi:hypothetical protein